VKNFHQHFRRPLLTEPDGCCDSPGFVLVCHKGNASQAQTSTQNGAQTQGVVITGSSFGGTTAGKVSSAPIGRGSSTATPSPTTSAAPFVSQPLVNTGTSVTLDTSRTITGNNNVIQDGIDPTAAASALSQLSNAFTGALSQLSTPPTQQSVATGGGTSADTSALTIGNGNTTPQTTTLRSWNWQLILAAISVALGALFLFRKKP
jgi:hypothetical protein